MEAPTQAREFTNTTAEYETGEDAYHFVGKNVQGVRIARLLNQLQGRPALPPEARRPPEKAGLPPHPAGERGPGGLEGPAGGHRLPQPLPRRAPDAPPCLRQREGGREKRGRGGAPRAQRRHDVCQRLRPNLRRPPGPDMGAQVRQMSGAPSFSPAVYRQAENAGRDDRCRPGGRGDCRDCGGGGPLLQQAAAPLRSGRSPSSPAWTSQTRSC